MWVDLAVMPANERKSMGAIYATCPICGVSTLFDSENKVKEYSETCICGADVSFRMNLESRVCHNTLALALEDYAAKGIHNRKQLRAYLSQQRKAKKARKQ